MLTEFGKLIKKRLIDLNKTQAWLIERLQEETNLYVDSSYLYKIMHGVNNSPKILAAIANILDLNEDLPSVCPAETTKNCS